jgi:hypothetical protein
LREQEKGGMLTLTLSGNPTSLPKALHLGPPLEGARLASSRRCGPCRPDEVARP